MPRLVAPSIAALALGLAGGSSLAVLSGRPEAAPPSAVAADGPRPDPRWSPAEVVRFQMEALRPTGGGQADFELCYRFASPANRKKVGPLERFRALLEDRYDAMVGHRAAAVGREYVFGPAATVLVTGVGSNGGFMCYQFTLSRQRGGEFDGCWMTDAVAEVRTDAGRPGEQGPPEHEPSDHEPSGKGPSEQGSPGPAPPRGAVG